MNTIIKWANLSDRQRWSVDGSYDYPWISELSDHDKGVLRVLSHVAEGEHSGLGSTILLMKLAPKSHVNDWASIALYSSIILYEEFRHGTIINALNGITLSDAEYGKSACLDTDNVHSWTAYSLLISYGLSEATNVMLYDNVINNIEDERVKAIFMNIKRDEARHLSAWKDLTKKLIDVNDFHKDHLLNDLDLAINYHNAEIHSDYMSGASESSFLWSGKSLQKVLEMKHDLLEYWFGDDNPYTVTKLKIAHVNSMRK